MHIHRTRKVTSFPACCCIISKTASKKLTYKHNICRIYALCNLEDNIKRFRFIIVRVAAATTTLQKYNIS